jgi:thiol-disulfide isomerase/thioredoxin
MKILKFGAVWCSGCLVMKPRWKKIEENNPWLKTEYYDFDNEEKMVKKYKIDENLTTFVFLDNNGSEIHRMSGEFSEKELLDIINKYKEK